MISYISIKNFAIIENSEIEFHKGLNIITGETGAGKSIVIEAISLALGARADVSFVRTGADKAIVQIVADIDEKDIVLTREVSKNGKNLCKVNGEIVTLTELNTYCQKIADIHGQYDHQSLLNQDYHITLIDKYHHELISPAKAHVSELYTEYIKLKSKLSKLLSDASSNEQKRDFMKFQLDEIRSAKLLADEDILLKDQISLMQNSEKIFKTLSDAYEKAYDGTPSALNLLEEISKYLSSLSSYSEDLSNLSERLADIYYNLEDISSELRRHRDNAIFSETELDKAIARYEDINALKRKYGNSIAEILAFADSLENSLSDIQNIDHIKSELESNLNEKRLELSNATNELTRLRKDSANELREKIIAELKDLAFANSELEIEFSMLPDFTENGIDSVAFLISTNKGEALKPLSKVASGGEMSRIMLAFKKIIADYDDIPTLIFDEIDTGISGIAASVVGKKLKEIAQNHQILCITHLPQIASCGTQNYRIEKNTMGDSTTTDIVALDKIETIKEIARLLGGTNITETTLASARELIESSN